MKKLMFAATVAAAMAGFAVESQVVGYQNLQSNEKEGEVVATYPTLSFTFQPMNDDQGWVSLGNVKATNARTLDNGDYFYQVLPEDATPGPDAYYYWDLDSVKAVLDEDLGEGQYTEEYAQSLVGWWWLDFAYEEPDDYQVNDLAFKAGTSFIGLILDGQNISLTCAGAVQDAPSNVNVSQQLYPTFGNPVPRTLKFSEVKVLGSCALDGDYFYQVLPEDATPGPDAFYYWDLDSVKAVLDEDLGEGQYTEEYAQSLVGWWWLDFAYEEPDDYQVNNRDVKPGESFIGLLQTGSQMEELTTVVSFPKGL